MSDRARIERRLPAILADLGAGPYPDYTDTLLARTAAARQRPAWAFPERWIPMSTAYTAAAALPRIPWRAIGAVALVIALLVGAAIIAGNAPRPLPAPFGPAANGDFIYAVDGDIHLGDPVAGTSRALTTGPEIDIDPWFAQDGTEFMFLRHDGNDRLQHLMVADADGSAVRQLTDEPFLDRTGWEWSGDGKSIVVTSSIGGRQTMSIVDVQTEAIRVLDVGMPVEDVFFRPPDGSEILFESAHEPRGLYVVDVDGSDLRRIADLEPYSAGSDWPSWGGDVWPQWSPDGSLIAYRRYEPARDETLIHVVRADGSAERVIENPQGVASQAMGQLQWSPDGTKLLGGRAYLHPVSQQLDRIRLVTLSLDDGAAIEFDLPIPTEPFAYYWAPDGRSIRVGWGEYPHRIYLIDVADGSYEIVSSMYSGTWQRVAS